jgi:hypothetical protein
MNYLYLLGLVFFVGVCLVVLYRIAFTAPTIPSPRIEPMFFLQRGDVFSFAGDYTETNWLVLGITDGDLIIEPRGYNIETAIVPLCNTNILLYRNIYV